MRFLAIFFLLAFAFANAHEVIGANSSLEGVQGARSAAVGGAVLALDKDLPSLSNSPLMLSNIAKTSIAFTHVAYFEGTVYNGVAMALPLRGAGTLGFAASRFGASDIPYIREGEDLPEGENYRTFSISDWLITSAWGKSFGSLNLSLSLHLLKRELDQSGWGFRSDIAAGYEVSKQLTLAGIVKGWTASSVQWESGHFEYSNPEFCAAFKLSEPFPYFYGKLNVYGQSNFSEHSGGLEFETDMLFSLRAGLADISDTKSLTLGAGVNPVSWLFADYAFQMHQTLSSVHRISVTASF